MTDLRENDVFRWAWNPDTGRDNHAPFGDYHCYSRIAIVRDGRLVDTFWGGYSGRKVVDPAMVDLKYQGNLEDFEDAKYTTLVHYRKEDILDLRHSNGGKVYLRKGAQKCPERRLAHLTGKLLEAQCRHRAAFRDAQSLIAQIKALKEGRMDEVYQ